MLKIAKPSILLLTLFLFAGVTFGQGKFRVESYDLKSNKVEFVLPPKSKLKLEGVKVKNQYHFIEVNNLSGDYSELVAELHRAKYYNSRRAEGRNKKVEFDTEVQGCGFCQIGHLPAEPGQGNAGFVLRIDYGKIFALSESEKVVEAFGDMAVALLYHFSKDDQSRNWPAILSQDIVQKVFEFIPLPQAASLLRYGVHMGREGSFILLNPSMLLKVDNVSLVETENDFRYQLQGETIVRIYRDRQGDIKQLPFLDFKGQGLPDNRFSDGGVVQGSSGDIQLSESVKGKPYVALYQRSFKRNNNYPKPGECAEVDDFLGSQCNSLLLHAASLGAFLDARPASEVPPAGKVQIDMNKFSTQLAVFGRKQDGTLKCGSPKDCKKLAEEADITRSYFGTRNLITPLITIHLNGRPTFVSLNMTLFELSSSYSLPAKLKFSRLRNGKYHKFQQISTATVLLPGDRLDY